jgi:hypothetical protein
MLLFMVFSTAHGQGNNPTSLNGQTFKLELTDEQDNVTHDMITFQETSFVTNAIKNSSYNATRYKIMKQPDGTYNLFAEAYSETEGTITYKGRFTGGQITGAMFTAKPGHPIVKRVFTGDLREGTERQD